MIIEDLETRGEVILEEQAAPTGEVLDPEVQSVPALWPAPGVLQEVPDLPYLLPDACLEGRDPGSQEGKLVKGRLWGGGRVARQSRNNDSALRN